MPVLGSALSGGAALVHGKCILWVGERNPPAVAGGSRNRLAVSPPRCLGAGCLPAGSALPGVFDEESLTTGTSGEAAELARSAFNKDLHATVLYAVLGGGLILATLSTSPWFELLLLGVSVPAVFLHPLCPPLFSRGPLGRAALPIGTSSRGSPGPGTARSQAMGGPAGA